MQLFDLFLNSPVSASFQLGPFVDAKHEQIEVCVPVCLWGLRARPCVYITLQMGTPPL